MSSAVSVLTHLLAFLIAGSFVLAQERLSPRAKVEEAIEEFQLAASLHPNLSGGIQQITQHLAQSLRPKRETSVFLDACHFSSSAAGSRFFAESKSAIAEIQRLLEGRYGTLPPSLAATVVGLRDDLMACYAFLAEVAILEFRSSSLRRGGAQSARADAKFRQALDQIQAGDFEKGMASLKSAWRGAAQRSRRRGEVIGEPPRICILSPDADVSVTHSPIAVSGMVHDLVSGSVSAEDVTVLVNGVSAVVVGGSFLATGVELRTGQNAIIAVAIDRDGNVATACSSVVLAPETQARILLVSGDGQTGPLGTPLREPLIIRLVDAEQRPVANQSVVFRVTAGNGMLAGGGRSAVAVTDSAGIATIGCVLGTRAGVGTNRVRATCTRFAGAAVFHAIGTNDAPAMIHVVRGDNQRGIVSAALASPLIAIVTDSGQNPVAGIPVTFTVEAGGGHLGGASSAVVSTDENGRAAVTWTLGPDAGFDNNRVAATFPGLQIEAASFKASAYVAGPVEETRVSGIVIDNQGAAVPGATIHWHGSTTQTQSDAEGVFVLEGVPVGHGLLVVDGSTTSREGTWPALEFEMDLLPGVDNTLDRPVYLLPLAIEDGEIAGGTEDVTIGIPEIPGFSMTVLAGSARFPGGGRTGLVSVTLVHANKIPMAPGSGMQPRFIVTIQPAGTHFDPPAPVTFPNSDALPPGTITEMFSFDHDLGEFVSIGTGTVSEDGLLIRSDPGVGIVKAGWHCAAPQSSSGRSASLSAEIKSGVGSECPGPPTRKKVVFAEPGQRVTIDACVGPTRDTSFEWHLEHPSLGIVTPASGTISSPQLTADLFIVEAGITELVLRIRCSTTHREVEDRIGICALPVRFDGMRPEEFTSWILPSTGRDVRIQILAPPTEPLQWTLEAIDPAVSGGASPSNGTESSFVARLDSMGRRESLATASLAENDPIAYRLTVSLRSGGSCCYVIRQSREATLMQEYQDFRDYRGMTLFVPIVVGPPLPALPFSPEDFNDGNYRSRGGSLDHLVINGNMSRIVLDTHAVYGRFRITSAYRNPRNNAMVSTSVNSSHQTGDAVDMAPESRSSADMYRLYRTVPRIGLSRLLLEWDPPAGPTLILMPSFHTPPAGTLAEATNLDLPVILEEYPPGSGSGSYRILLNASTRTVPLAEDTMVIQGTSSATVVGVLDLSPEGAPQSQYRLTFAPSSGLAAGPALMRTPYSRLFSLATHVHAQ